MRIRTLVGAGMGAALAAGGLVTTLATPVSAHSVGMPFEAASSPLLPGGGDPDGTMTGTFTLNEADLEVCIETRTSQGLGRVVGFRIRGPVPGGGDGGSGGGHQHAGGQATASEAAEDGDAHEGDGSHAGGGHGGDHGTGGVPSTSAPTTSMPIIEPDDEPRDLGPVVVDFDGKRCATLDGAAMTALHDELASHVLVVHTEEHPDGAVLATLDGPMAPLESDDTPANPKAPRPVRVTPAYTG